MTYAACTASASRHTSAPLWSMLLSQCALDSEATQPVENGCLEQADAAKTLGLRGRHEAPDACREHVRDGHTVDPWSRVEQVPHREPFHSEDGMASGDTGFLRPRCLPAPRNDRARFAGTIRT